MPSLERIVRPFQTKDVTPPKRILQKSEDTVDNVLIQCGKIGSTKTFNASYSSTITSYVPNQQRELTRDASVQADHQSRRRKSICRCRIDRQAQDLRRERPADDIHLQEQKRWRLTLHGASTHTRASLELDGRGTKSPGGSGPRSTRKCSSRVRTIPSHSASRIGSRPFGRRRAFAGATLTPPTRKCAGGACRRSDTIIGCHPATPTPRSRPTATPRLNSMPLPVPPRSPRSISKPRRQSISR